MAAFREDTRRERVYCKTGLSGEILCMKEKDCSLSRRYFLRSVGATLSLPTLHSLVPGSFGVTSALGASVAKKNEPSENGCSRKPSRISIAVSFPRDRGESLRVDSAAQAFQNLRDDMTIYRGLDHGVKGGHFAVHSFLTGVLSMDAKGRPDGISAWINLPPKRCVEKRAFLL